MIDVLKFKCPSLIQLTLNESFVWVHCLKCVNVRVCYCRMTMEGSLILSNADKPIPKSYPKPNPNPAPHFTFVQVISMGAVISLNERDYE